MRRRGESSDTVYIILANTTLHFIFNYILYREEVAYLPIETEIKNQKKRLECSNQEDYRTEQKSDQRTTQRINH